MIFSSEAARTPRPRHRRRAVSSPESPSTAGILVALGAVLVVWGGALA